MLCGHKGKYSLEITTSSAGGMATTPDPDADAIALAMQIAAALKQHVHGWAKPPPADIAPVVEQAKIRGYETQGQSYVVYSTTVNIGTGRLRWHCHYTWPRSTISSRSYRMVCRPTYLKDGVLRSKYYE